MNTHTHSLFPPSPPPPPPPTHTHTHTHTYLSLFAPSNTNAHPLPPRNTQTLSPHLPGIFFLPWATTGWPLSVRFLVLSPSVPLITRCTLHTSSMCAPSTTGNCCHGYSVAIVTNTHTQSSQPCELWSCCKATQPTTIRGHPPTHRGTGRGHGTRVSNLDNGAVSL